MARIAFTSSHFLPPYHGKCFPYELALVENFKGARPLKVVTLGKKGVLRRRREAGDGGICARATGPADLPVRPSGALTGTGPAAHAALAAAAAI